MPISAWRHVVRRGGGSDQLSHVQPSVDGETGRAGASRSHSELSRSSAARISAIFPCDSVPEVPRQYHTCGNTGMNLHFGPPVIGRSRTPFPNSGRRGPPNGSPNNPNRHGNQTFVQRVQANIALELSTRIVFFLFSSPAS